MSPNGHVSIFLSEIVDRYRLEPFQYTQGGVAIILDKFDLSILSISSFMAENVSKCVEMGQNEPE